MKLLAKLPEDRYQSAYGLQADLDRCLAQWQASGRIEPFPLGTEDIPERFQVPHKLYGRDHEAANGCSAPSSAWRPPARRRWRPSPGTRASASRRWSTRCASRLSRSMAISFRASSISTSAIFRMPPSRRRFANWCGNCWPKARRASPAGGNRSRLRSAVNGQLIVDVLPQVELIIGPQPPVPALPPTEAQNRFRMVFRQFVTVFTSEDHPLVLFLDDLQWIDAASLTLIERPAHAPGHALSAADRRLPR